MNLRSVYFIVMMSVLIAVISGCATTTEQSGEGVAGGAGVDGAAAAGEGDQDGTRSFGLNDNGLRLDELNNPDSPLSNRTIYFEYDSSSVKPEYREVLSAHGQFLANNPSQRMRLEGHTDERGTREYNLALGESRALAVRQILLLEGATGSQFEIISFGEEQPAVIGQDENAMSMNRRVEIVY